MNHPHPTRLGFYKEGKTLYGYDPDNDVTYLIRWCGNGAYSHYYLSPMDDLDTGFYSYIHHKETNQWARFHDAIREAEYWLIYHATADCKARPDRYGCNVPSQSSHACPRIESTR